MASLVGLPAAARANDHQAMAGTWQVISIDANGTLDDSENVRRIMVINEPNGDWCS